MPSNLFATQRHPLRLIANRLLSGFHFFNFLCRDADWPIERDLGTCEQGREKITLIALGVR